MFHSFAAMALLGIGPTPFNVPANLNATLVFNNSQATNLPVKSVVPLAWTKTPVVTCLGKTYPGWQGTFTDPAGSTFTLAFAFVGPANGCYAQLVGTGYGGFVGAGGVLNPAAPATFRQDFLIWQQPVAAVDQLFFVVTP
jgi:hypothetical protein